MATIEEIREALAARVTQLDGWRAAQEWGEKINVSGSAGCGVIQYDGAQYNAAMDGQAHNLLFKVTFVAGKASDRAARKKLDALCDPTEGSATSPRTVLDGRLGDVVAFATVTASTGFREYGPDEDPSLGIEFLLEVAAT